MAKEISRKFRPEFKDFEVMVEDDHGIRRPMYVCIGQERCGVCGSETTRDQHGVVDVDGAVRVHLNELESEGRRHEGILRASGHEEIADAMRARRQVHSGALSDEAALMPRLTADPCVPCEDKSNG